MTRRTVLFVVACLAAACGGGGDDDQELLVLAAASLSEAFTELGEAFETTSGVRVDLSFEASSALVRQLEEGAPADVVATADEDTMHMVRDRTGPPAVFARNTLAIVVERQNPLAIGGVRDLARPDVTYVMCAPQVPCGRLARTVLDRAGVSATPASEEDNVKAVVSKVVLGEADAGIVYVTDVKAAARVDSVALPLPDNVTTSYPIAVVKSSGRARIAERFRAYVMSSAGQAVLARYGFLPR